MRREAAILLALIGIGCGGGDDDVAPGDDGGGGGGITCAAGEAPPVVLKCDGTLGALAGDDQGLLVASSGGMLRVDLGDRSAVVIGAATAASPVAGDGGDVYWADPFDVMRASTSGGAPEVRWEAEGDFLDIHDLALGDEEFYFTEEAANLWGGERAAEGASFLRGPLVAPMEVAVAPDAVLVTASDQIVRVMEGGSTPFATLPGVATGLVAGDGEAFALTPGGLVAVSLVEDETVREVEPGGGDGELQLAGGVLLYTRVAGGVHRVATDGSGAAEVAPAVTSIGGLWATASTIYWTDGGELRATPVP